MDTNDERSGYRIRGRVERIGPEEFVAVATALPDNGDPSKVHTLSEILASLHVAQDTVRTLVKRMCAIVAANGDRVTDVETDVRT